MQTCLYNAPKLPEKPPGWSRSYFSRGERHMRKPLKPALNLSLVDLRLNRQAFPCRNMSILCLLTKRLELWRFQNETRLSQGVVVINTLLSLLRNLDGLGSAGWAHGVPRGQSEQWVTSAGCTGASHGPVAEPRIQEDELGPCPQHSELPRRLP